MIVELDLETFVATLPPATARSRSSGCLNGLEPDQIAERPGKKANAVYQAISRNETRLGVAGGEVDLEMLFEELAVRHARGEPLDVEGTLRRAGNRADELARLIDAFLARAPRREPTPRALAFVRSLDDPPMVRARVAKALKVDDVVDAILTECALDAEARPKVRRYYQQLEGGILDPNRVAAACGTRSPASSAGRAPCSRPCPGRRPRPLRCTAEREGSSCTSGSTPSRRRRPSPSQPQPDPHDEVDALFTGDAGA